MSPRLLNTRFTTEFLFYTMNISELPFLSLVTKEFMAYAEYVFILHELVNLTPIPDGATPKSLGAIFFTS